MLDLTSLNNALAQLRDSLDRCRDPAYVADPALIRTIRTAAIKGFEMAYELCIRTLRRHLEQADMVAPDTLTYRDLLRLAAERGLVTDPVAWFRYQDMRNQSAHTYDEGKAAAIAELIPEFHTAAEELQAALERINPCI
ncbi:MAG: HI0074 family nucleotidyltransferase substrate-binding subunit [Fimbriiglobus sp.]